MNAIQPEGTSRAGGSDTTTEVVDGRTSAPIALIVDPDATAAAWSAGILERFGFETTRAATAAEAVDRLQARRAAIACVDADVADMAAPVLVKRLTAAERIPVVVTAKAPTVRMAVELVRAGAADVVEKGAEQALEHGLRAVMAQRRAIGPDDRGLERAAFLRRYNDLFRGSVRMHAVEQMVARVASLRAPVLVLGEPGAGKEQVALAIHYLSDRQSAPFVRIGCGSVPPEQVEREIFGNPGVEAGQLAAAAGGTAFLDDVADAPSGVQSRLARIIHDSSVDVRFIASVSTDVYALLAAGRLRSDLYETLAVATITVPPLRERREEVEVLARRFLDSFSAAFERSKPVMTEAMAEALRTYDWPGNVRELENLMKRWVVLGVEADITAELEMRSAATRRAAAVRAGAPGLREIGRRAAREAERMALQEALARARGNRSAAARALKVSYKTLLQKLATLGLASTKPLHETRRAQDG
jgi:DNA-binding NtrC family response regulator